MWVRVPPRSLSSLICEGVSRIAVQAKEAIYMVIASEIGIRTKGDCDVIDVTAQVKQEGANSGLSSGTVTVFVTGSTASVSTAEYLGTSHLR